MTDSKREIFSEIDAFLDIIDEESRNKIPQKLRNLYKENKKEGYNPVYTWDKPLEEQNLKKGTISMIALLHLNYWCKTEEEKKELRAIFKENEEKHQNDLMEKYNTDDLLKNDNSVGNEDNFTQTNQEEVSMIEYKEPFYIKIINFIKKFFIKKK